MSLDCPHRRWCLLGLFLAAGLGVWAIGPLAAQEVSPEVSAEVDRLIAELDQAEFATRHAAALRLEALAGRGELGEYLSGRFHRALLTDTTSYEVRSKLEALLRILPPPAVQSLQPDPAQIVPLLDQLQSDVYAQRDGAARQIRSMLAHDELIVPLWLELKRHFSDPALPAAGRRALEPLLDAAHEAWLLAEPGQVPLPEPDDEQIAAWIDELASLETPAADLPAPRSAAERELLDLIARDDTRDKVLGMVREKIAASGDEAAGNRLGELLEFARPAMAAEVWTNHRHIYQQYLIIGMPQYNDTVTARKATLFDRIDEQTAHCVSGNALNPGDYPVRVAIPHPQPGQETMYYLTNLSTPRRRLAYEYHLRRDEQLRLEDISQRTLTYFLNRLEPLSETEVLMLFQLDARTVSRSSGRYFETVRNGRLISTLNGPGGMTTVHGAICAVLCRVGTREAVPALERLAREGTLGKLSNENRLDVAWIAALATARRDPWEGVDDWLAGLVDQNVPLTAEFDAPPDLGASAAGLLLDRHGASTTPFGLETAGESMTDSLQFVGYRFHSEQSRQDIKAWWKRQQARAEAGRAAGLAHPEPLSVPSIRLAPLPAKPENQ